MEQVISFETAKIAKEKGFKDMTTHYYLDNGSLKENRVYVHYGNDGDFYVELEEFLESYNSGWVATEKGEFCFGCASPNYMEVFSAPSQSVLQKWLREVHDIDVTVWIRFADAYGVLIYKNRNNVKGYDEIIVHPTPDNYKTGVYEDALERGLRKALELV